MFLKSVKIKQNLKSTALTDWSLLNMISIFLNILRRNFQKLISNVLAEAELMKMN